MYVKKLGRLELIDAIEKCTLIPAQILEESTPAMKRKGRLQEGADADVIVFDLSEVHDEATFQKPAVPSAGMKHVLVNGVPLITDGELDPAVLPGRPVRRDILVQT